MTIELTARQIIDRIFEYLEEEAEGEELAEIVRLMFGGTLDWNEEKNTARLEGESPDWFDTIFDFEPNRFYSGAFDKIKSDNE